MQQISLSSQSLADTPEIYSGQGKSTVNDELCKLYDWLIANKLSLNIKKLNYVIFRPRQKNVNYEVNFKIFNHHTNFYTSLERKSYVKYLGVLIDENHLLHTASKISTSIGIIARLRHFVPLNILNIQIIDSTLFILQCSSVGPSRQNSQKQNPMSSETCPSPHVFL